MNDVPAVLRKVTRVEPDTLGRHAVFLECGHMYRVTVGPDTAPGNKRLCVACGLAPKVKP